MCDRFGAGNACRHAELLAVQVKQGQHADGQHDVHQSSMPKNNDSLSAVETAASIKLSAINSQ